MVRVAILRPQQKRMRCSVGIRPVAFEVSPIVFRHLSPAAFCKRLVLTVDSTVICCDRSEKSNDRKHLDRPETIEWE